MTSRTVMAEGGLFAQAKNSLWRITLVPLTSAHAIYLPQLASQITHIRPNADRPVP